MTKNDRKINSLETLIKREDFKKINFIFIHTDQPKKELSKYMSDYNKTIEKYLVSDKAYDNIEKLGLKAKSFLIFTGVHSQPHDLFIKKYNALLAYLNENNIKHTTEVMWSSNKTDSNPYLSIIHNSFIDKNQE